MHCTVSVIIPAYQSAQTLPRAIDSVLQQQYDNFEIIVADDCSSDNTKDILEQYKRLDSRIKYILLEKNSGPGGARNAGVAMARGELFAFLDADDVWQPHKLKRQVDFLVHNPDVDVVFCDSTNLNMSDGTTSKLSEINGDFLRRLPLLAAPGYKDFYLLGGSYREELYRKFFILISSVLIRRSAVERANGFNPNRRGTEDIDFFVRLAAHSRFAYWYDEQVIRYQTNQGISSVNEKWLKEWLNYHQMCLDSSDYFDLTDLVRANITKAYRNLILYYGEKKLRLQVIKVYRESQMYGFNWRLLTDTSIALLGSWPISWLRSIQRIKIRAVAQQKKWKFPAHPG